MTPADISLSNGGEFPQGDNNIQSIERIRKLSFAVQIMQHINQFLTKSTLETAVPKQTLTKIWG